jgi:hypothetical protein
MKTSVTRVSPFSGKSHTMEIDIDPRGFSRWKAGEMIQVAMPELTADEREFLMTGITPEEWAETFGEEE